MSYYPYDTKVDKYIQLYNEGKYDNELATDLYKAIKSGYIPRIYIARLTEYSDFEKVYQKLDQLGLVSLDKPYSQCYAKSVLDENLSNKQMVRMIRLLGELDFLNDFREMNLTNEFNELSRSIQVGLLMEELEELEPQNINDRVRIRDIEEMLCNKLNTSLNVIERVDKKYNLSKRYKDYIRDNMSRDTQGNLSAYLNKYIKGSPMLGPNALENIDGLNFIQLKGIVQAIKKFTTPKPGYFQSLKNWWYQ